MSAIVVMGVSGAGKSTLGRALAEELNYAFVEGDTLHPASNIKKMAAGIPLNDVDRRPFLERVAEVCHEQEAAGVVVSCSALTRTYRDLIRSRSRSVVFVLPMVDREKLQRRLVQRQHHFMPASLLESQLASLEIPSSDERAVLIDGAAETAAQVAETLKKLHAHQLI
jgi:gluconokinase